MGASATLVEADKKISVNQKTDAEGRFVFTNLLPGRYNLTVEMQGFKKLERTDINLLANDKITVGIITLDVGSISDVVEVQAQSTQLKTESAERSDAMTATELENVAVNSRSYLQLVGFLPGVVSTANLNTGGHAGLANISANGARFDQNNLTLNGLGNVDTGNNGDQLATISPRRRPGVQSPRRHLPGRIRPFFGRADQRRHQVRYHLVPRFRLLVASP